MLNYYVWDALLLRLCNQDVKGWLLRLMLLPYCFDSYQRRFRMLWNLFNFVDLDVKDPYLHFFWFMML